MASPNVESQRLISLSLGKIAQSRSQKGGINLHKNLLVATVLHKARTACMMEYQSLQRQQRQREFELKQRQQQLQQQKDAAALEFEQKQEQARSAALSRAAFNTSESPAVVIPTCVREMEVEEEQHQTTDNQAMTSSPSSSSACGPVLDNCEQVLNDTGAAAPNTTESAAALVPASASEVNLGQQHAASPGSAAGVLSDLCNKENSPPCQISDDVFDVDFDEDLEDSGVQVVPQSTCPASPLDHLAAATQLAEDAAADLAPSRDQKQRCTTSATITCKVLKRQRDNSGASHDQECPPASKKARLVAVTRRDSCCSKQHITSINNNTHEAGAACSDTEQHNNVASTPSFASSDSSQISNLVSIFNSGFTGLCPVNHHHNNNNTVDYSSAASCDVTSGQADSHNLGSYSLKVAEPSLSCSSSLGRLDSLPASLGLALTV